MARIRTIKPEFWTDEAILSVSRNARLCLIGMFNFADDEGRMDDSPIQIKARIFPGDMDMGAKELQGLLVELSNAYLIKRYSVDNKHYLEIKNFRKHQKIDRPNPSSIPAPSRAIGEDSPNGSEQSPPEGNGREGNGKDITPLPPKGGVVYSEDFERFYKVYPKKMGGKEKAFKIWERRQRAGTLPPIDYLLLAVKKLIGWEGWLKENGKFIPYVTSFLNAGKWSDADDLPMPKLVDMGRRGRPGCEKCGGKGWWFDRDADTGRQCSCVERES
jgi:hypothetical protein